MKDGLDKINQDGMDEKDTKKAYTKAELTKLVETLFVKFNGNGNGEVHKS